MFYIIIDSMSTHGENKNKADIVIHALLQQGMVKTATLIKLGVTRSYLNKMKTQGLLTQPSHGYYSLPQRAVSEYHGLIDVSVAIPGSIICLLSALQFHRLTTQNPFKIWIAISRGDRSPSFNGVPLAILRYSPASFAEGIECHSLEGVTVRVFNIAKTVADCFKYRNKIGIDVALEALKECLQKRMCTIDELWRYARICRVGNIMRPYMEALG